jgi:hypothetical protein
MPLIVPVTTCVIGAMRDESKRPLEDLAIGLSRLCQFSIHPADELFQAYASKSSSSAERIPGFRSGR